MKSITTFIILFCVCSTFAQGYYKERYRVPHKYGFIPLQKLTKTPQGKLPNFSKLKQEFKDKYKVGETITYSYKQKVGDHIYQNEKSLFITQPIQDSLLLIFENKTVTTTQDMNECPNCKYKILGIKISETAKRKAFIKFENDTIFVNPYLNSGDSQLNQETILFYKLKNRQYVKLNYQTFPVTALTIPIKYRFKGKGDVEEEFSSSFNVNLFAGYTTGKQLFRHRKKVGNKISSLTGTIGGFIGGNVVELNESNSRNLSSKLNQGALSYGGGIALNYDKINIGFFVGWDKIVGANRDNWKFNDKVWLGIGIGYDLFKLQGSGIE